MNFNSLCAVLEFFQMILFCRFYSEPSVPPPGYPSSEYSPALFPTSAAGGDPKAAESEAKPKKTWGDAALWAVTGLAVILLIGLIVVVVLLVRQLDEQRQKGKGWDI